MCAGDEVHRKDDCRLTPVAGRLHYSANRATLVATLTKSDMMRRLTPCIPGMYPRRVVARRDTLSVKFGLLALLADVPSHG